VRKNGSIVAADFDYNALTQKDFFNACITETKIPELSGDKKEPAYMEVKIQPERTKNAKASGKLQGDFGKNRQKSWLPCNFRLEIGDLVTKKVSKIESFTIKQTIATDSIGDAREYAIEPGKLEIPNLKITLAETDKETWQAWAEDFIVAGNCAEENEKNGRIVFLSPNNQELAAITLGNIGIKALSEAPMEANSDKIKSCTSELYVEKMAFEYSASGTD
jgi:hypothetical protein